ncbi:hypothetical protein B0H17DRAFT_1029228 [Mycena rosella]|uniref:F-box domain-containing protein n=1 Tax=Mycena rosella TaxID=1033263 RepID=A0AAD7H1K4_MYCRO|nr:hypothetical protein B0H17DRAFT_1029228 [Mycena rosella]
MVEDAATIGSLPSELLAHIFKSGTRLSSPCPSCLPALVAYSAVSQQWRAAALNYPDLWTQICVPFSMRNAVAWIGLCLDRSKSCLFDITMQLPADDASAVIIGVMRLVLQNVQRLRRLAISADSFLAHPGELFALLQNAQRAPRLAVLELTFADPSPAATMRIPPGGLLLQAPSLSSLLLHGVASPVPFVGLRSLDIQGLRTTYADFRDMTVASPLLTNLILPKLRLMVDLQSKLLPPIEIASLRTLALSFCKPLPSNSFAPCHNLLSILKLPNLEYLELAGGNVPDLAKCFPDPSAFTKLRTLRLVGAPIFTRASPTEPGIDNCVYLRSLAAVEELELIHSYAEYLLPTENKVETSTENGPRQLLPRRRSINMRDVGPSAPYKRVEHFRMYAGAGYGHGGPGIYGQPTAPNPDSVPIYPNLRSVSLDTLLAGEAVWLYQLVSQRPQIKVVHLSPVAERHFAMSLAMVDGVLQTLPNRNQIGAPDHDPVDVGKLLRERVSVNPLQTEGYIPAEL